jgi:hypothetical protein
MILVILLELGTNTRITIFLNKIYKFNIDESGNYYMYHLAHALDNSICTEEYFFSKVWGIVEDGIRNLKTKDPFSSYHDRYKFRI